MILIVFLFCLSFDFLLLICLIVFVFVVLSHWFCFYFAFVYNWKSYAMTTQVQVIKTICMSTRKACNGDFKFCLCFCYLLKASCDYQIIILWNHPSNCNFFNWCKWYVSVWAISKCFVSYVVTFVAIIFVLLNFAKIVFVVSIYSVDIKLCMLIKYNDKNEGQSQDKTKKQNSPNSL